MKSKHLHVPNAAQEVALVRAQEKRNSSLRALGAIFDTGAYDGLLAKYGLDPNGDPLGQEPTRHIKARSGVEHTFYTAEEEQAILGLRDSSGWGVRRIANALGLRMNKVHACLTHLRGYHVSAYSKHPLEDKLKRRAAYERVLAWRAKQ